MASLPSNSGGHAHEPYDGPYEALFRLAPDIVLFLTPEGDISGANEAAVQAYGYDRDELEGLNIADVRADSTIALIDDQLKKATEEGLVFETEHKRKDGSTFPVEVSSVGVQTPEGKMLLSVVRDITARREADRERESLIEQVQDLARVSEQRARELDAMFEALTDAVLIHDEHATVVGANPAAVSTYGFDPTGIPRRELLDRLFIRRPDGTSLKPEEIPSSRAVAGETVWNERLIFRRADGADLTIVASASPLMVDGVACGSVTVWRDVTDLEAIHFALQESAHLNETLIALNATIAASLDRHEILQAVTIEAGDAIRADGTMVFLCDGNRWIVAAAREDGRPAGPRSNNPMGAELSRLIQAGSRPVAVRDAWTDRRVDNDLFHRLGIRSLLVVPLTAQRTLEGLLLFYGSDDGAGLQRSAFSHAELDFAENLGVSVSLALANAELYRTQRVIAGTVQEAWLDLPSRIEGITAGSAYHSATEQARIGGDFLDLFPVGDQIAVVVGDVSGKGVEAASLASLARNSIKAYVHDDPSPASALHRTNGMLCDVMPERGFATVFLAIVDPASGWARYCCAGHPPAAVRPTSRPPLLLPVGSQMVGGFANARFDEGTLEMTPGDLLIAYTDGVTEARRKGEFFGEKRLLRLIGEMETTAPDHVAAGLMEAVETYAGGALRDDVAILAIRME